MDDLALRIRGHTCPFDLLPSCRLLQFEEADGNATLLDVFEQHLTRKERGSLQLPLLLDYPRKDYELAPSLLQCKARLGEITGGLLGEMMGDPVILGAVVVAGGFITAALTGCAALPGWNCRWRSGSFVWCKWRNSRRSAHKKRR